MPYENISVSETEIIRFFSCNTDSEELKWHRDRETRQLQLVHATDWQLQLDNALPEPLQTGLTIPAGVWHRLIQGTGDLTVRIILQ